MNEIDVAKIVEPIFKRASPTSQASLFYVGDALR